MAFLHALRVLVPLGSVALASPAPLSPTNIFAPVSTPAHWIVELSRLVLIVTATIFVVVFTLLAYAAVTFRRRGGNDAREPAQVYGSTQLEVAWTVIPILIVVVLFLASAHVIASTQERYCRTPP
jgi:cytochrome c oxidase subunit 2